MAILSKIRERSLFLILVIGLALFAFVLDPTTISDFFNSSKVNEIGKVNGETISREEFAIALDDYRTKAGGRVSEMQAAKTVWNNLTRQKIYETQLKEAGITVGEADIMNSLYESQSVQSDPRFQTTGIFDKDKLKEHLVTIKAQNSNEWKAWQNYMLSLKNSLQRSTYNNLVGAGLGASLQEGKTAYLHKNTKLNGDLVYVPFTSVADSLITVKKDEVEKYIEEHKKDFQVEASRDIKFVKFDIKPSSEDEEAVKQQVAKLLEDREEYSTVTKGNVIVKGLKKAVDYKSFLQENKSDLPLNDEIQFKVQVPQVIAEDIFKGEKGDVFGPYKDKGHYKISKITQVTMLPDSVSASHILIPFKGALSADADVSRTKENAKKLADSLLTVVKANTGKFSNLAKTFSSDKGSSDKGGKYEWFEYNRMTPAFRDFCFENKKGDMDVVETPFGYHVIKIDGQKNFQNAVKLATFARKIEASETTENLIFENAETFALNISKGKNFDELVKDKKLSSSSAQELKALDEDIPSLGKERQIISWSFEKDRNIGDYKRFDVEGGYVVAVITAITKEGLMPAYKALVDVRPIIDRRKRAEIIANRMKEASLEEIAKLTGQTVRKISDITLEAPTISGIGREPKLVGAMVNAQENKLYNKVVGDRGVYAFKVTSKKLPVELDNYETFRTRIVNDRKGQSFRMYEAIKNASEVENNTSSFYGIQSR